MALTKFQTEDQTLSLIQTSWASDINPVLANPMNNGVLLKSVSLAAGTNNINHLLGKTLQGWVLIRVRAFSVVYDTQDVNPIPNLTLQLTASAAVVVDLYVF